jgi:EmrB/QacA subfamily drug resistance transporter
VSREADGGRGGPPQRVNPPAEELYARKWPIFGVMMIGWAMTLLDVSIVNITVPELQHDLSTDVDTVSWVVNAYNITFGVILVATGRLADQFGRRRFFVLGLSVFTIGSALCALAWTVEALIVFRIIQGLGAGILAPLGFAMTALVFPPRQRGMGLALIAVVALVSTALGPVIGGVLVEFASWHWIFIINIPIGIVGVLLARRVWPETWDLTAPRQVDIVGMLLLGLSGFCAAYGLVEANSRGWDDGLILFLLQASIFLGIAFFFSQRFGKAPMLTHGLMENKQFLGANGAMLLFAMGALGALFLLALVFVNLWGYSQLEAGLALAPVPLMGLVVWPIVGRAADRKEPRQIAVPALAVMAVGLLAFSFMPSTAEDTLDYLMVLPALLLIGTGMGMCFPSINVGAMGSVTGQELGLASGLLNTSRQIGAGLGIALLVAVMAAVGTERLEWAREELRDELNDVYELPAPLAGGLLLQTFGDRAGLTEQRLRLGPGFDEEVARLSSRATRTAYAWGFRGAAVFVLLAIPLAKTMRRNPAQARAAQAAAAGAAPPPPGGDEPAGGDGGPRKPRPALQPE